MTACDDAHRQGVTGERRPLVHKLELLVLFMLGNTVHKGVNLVFRIPDPANYLFTWHDERFRDQVMAYLCANYKADEFNETIVYNKNVDSGWSFGPHKSRMLLKAHLEERNERDPGGAVTWMFSVEQLPPFHWLKTDD